MRHATRFLTSGILAATIAACASASGGDLPDGYFLAPRAPALPENDIDTSEPHTAVVQRMFDDETEERMLRIAESVYPPREQVDVAAERGFAGAAEPDPDEPLWWHGEFDGVRLPYAITADAVAYYGRLHERFEAGDSLAAGPIAMDTTSFRYEADVEHEASFELNGESYEDVYVVRMRLHWSNWCGNLCALTVDKERTVVLDQDGSVLAVDGDGASPVTVS